jgi:Tol biopolymer transport system component
MPMMHIWEFNALTGDHSPVTSGSTQYRLSTLSATATGTLIANTKAFSLTLWATDAAGKAQLIPSSRSEGWDSVVWIGNRIVTGTLVGMMRHDLEGGKATELRSQSSIHRELSRCGPGRVAYWAADEKRKGHIARTDISTGATSALTDGPRDSEPSCTPDGSTLVFVHCAELSNRCFLTRKSLDTGQTLELYEFIANNEVDPSPSVSPDGTSVIFINQPEDGDPNGWVMTIPINGGEPKKLKMAFPDADFVRWGPDGKGFYYVRTKNGVGNVWSAPMEGKPVTQLTDFNSDKIFSFDVSADKRLVIARGTMTSDIVLIKMTR